MRVRHTYVARGPWGGGAAAPGVRGQQNNGCEERTGSSAWNACHLAHLPCSQAAPRRRVGGAERGTVRPAAGSPREPTRAGTGQPRRLGIILSFHRVYQPGPVRAAAPGPYPVARPVEGSRVEARWGARYTLGARDETTRTRGDACPAMFPDRSAPAAGRVAPTGGSLAIGSGHRTVVPPSSGPPTKAPRAIRPNRFSIRHKARPCIRWLSLRTPSDRIQTRSSIQRDSMRDLCVAETRTARVRDRPCVGRG